MSTAIPYDGNVAGSFEDDGIPRLYGDINNIFGTAISLPTNNAFSTIVPPTNINIQWTSGSGVDGAAALRLDSTKVIRAKDSVTVANIAVGKYITY